MCHSVACILDISENCDSAKGAPLICRPIGSPDFEKPHGGEIVGSPNTLMGNGDAMSRV